MCSIRAGIGNSPAAVTALCIAGAAVWSQQAALAQGTTCDGEQHVPCDTAWHAENNRFGIAAITERRGVIGSRGDDEAEENTGAVYVYHRIDGEWVFATKIVHPDPNEAEFLGESVAIDGTRLVAAAPGYDFGRGRLLVFDYDAVEEHWSLSSDLSVSTIGTLSGDLLGGDGTDHRRCVALSSVMIVGGAPFGTIQQPAGGCGTNPIIGGYVAVFIGQQEFLFTSSDFGSCPVSDDRFGASVVVDDDRLAIGEPGRDRVYLARYENGSWVSEGVLSSPTGSGSGFGFDVALDGGRLAVGAPTSNKVHLYRLGPSGWQIEESIDHPDMISSIGQFGTGVSLHGSLLLVGDPAHEPNGDQTGQFGGAFLFQRDSNGDWQHVRTFLSGNSYIGGYGYSVALHGDDAVVSTTKEHYSDGQTFIPSLGGAFFYKNLPACEPYDPLCGGN